MRIRPKSFAKQKLFRPARAIASPTFVFRFLCFQIWRKPSVLFPNSSIRLAKLRIEPRCRLRNHGDVRPLPNVDDAKKFPIRRSQDDGANKRRRKPARLKAIEPGIRPNRIVLISHFSYQPASLGFVVSTPPISEPSRKSILE